MSHNFFYKMPLKTIGSITRTLFFSFQMVQEASGLCLQSDKHNVSELVLQVISPSVCSFIVFWFPLSFTTCFGLHGHLHVCRIFRIFIFIYLRILLRCLFFTWSHSACFPSVSWSCAVFLRVVWCFLAYAFVCLLFIVVV
jgi:hypothetical protein